MGRTGAVQYIWVDAKGIIRASEKGWHEGCEKEKCKKELFGMEHKGSWKARKERGCSSPDKTNDTCQQKRVEVVLGWFLTSVTQGCGVFLTSSWHWCCNPHWGFAKCETKESICFSCFSSALVRFFSRVVFSFALIYSLSHHVFSPMLLFSIKFNVPSQILWESLPPWTVHHFFI